MFFELLRIQSSPSAARSIHIALVKYQSKLILAEIQLGVPDGFYQMVEGPVFPVS